MRSIPITELLLPERTMMTKPNASGGPMVSKRGANRHNPDKPFYYYACRKAVREKKCDAPTLRCDGVDTAVLDALRLQPLDEVAIQRIWNEIGDPLTDPMLQSMRAELSQAERKQRNLIKNFEDSTSIPKAVG